MKYEAAMMREARNTAKRFLGNNLAGVVITKETEMGFCAAVKARNGVLYDMVINNKGTEKSVEINERKAIDGKV